MNAIRKGRIASLEDECHRMRRLLPNCTVHVMMKHYIPTLVSLLVRLLEAAMAGWIQSGKVRAGRSPWRLSIIPDTFFALVNLIRVFFRTMFSLDAHQNYGKRSDNRRPGSYGGGGGFGPGGPGGPGGPPGGYGRGPRRGMDAVRGIDHSATPPCGSCCAG